MRYRISYLMDEIWERAVETALEGETNYASARTLTLDGAVKCVQGRLPPPSLLERFQNLQHLSIANIGVSSLEQFPKLRNLQKLILSDNRIAGGLEFLVQAGLDSLRDLDLSNNRIQYIEDLAPLAQLKLVSLDLYECPVTRVKDYRSRVFGLIKSLKYLDKMDAEENERPESDDEDEEDEEDEDDPGSGEIDGEDRPFGMNNGHSEGVDGVVDAEEDEESDADEEETETSRRTNGLSHKANGFRVAPAGGDDAEEDDEDGDEEEENDSGEEIDEEEGDDDDVVEVHEIEDSDDEEDGVEYDEDDEDEEDEEEEEVDNDDGDLAAPESTGRLASTEGEIDGHEQGEDVGDEDDNGETGEDEVGVEDDGEFEDDDEEEDYGAGYLVQPVGQSEAVNIGSGEMDGGNVDGEEEVDDDEGQDEEEVDDDEEDVQVLPPAASNLKRKRDDDGENNDDDDDVVASSSNSSKKHH
ncbi:hypothetical protein QN277_027772 [Acacia crassicarpa]|uniref:Acidic leucine-rich nuclear phosphoprotein 32-related protein n=1 Tax=Acacia crassicarpa TaxID=499986 RepID=A0AAE1J4G8_9FABA|nr:hypothetical protein QN277_027772 [Acacia crassicarpa]